MDREPQLKDRVATPGGSGEVVARSQMLGHWIVRVRLDKEGSIWEGSAQEVELLEAAGEEALRRMLKFEKG